MSLVNFVQILLQDDLSISHVCDECMNAGVEVRQYRQLTVLNATDEMVFLVPGGIDQDQEKVDLAMFEVPLLTAKLALQEPRVFALLAELYNQRGLGALANGLARIEERIRDGIRNIRNNAEGEKSE